MAHCETTADEPPKVQYKLIAKIFDSFHPNNEHKNVQV